MYVCIGGGRQAIPMLMKGARFSLHSPLLLLVVSVVVKSLKDIYQHSCFLTQKKKG